tara:strand:+ start:1397 stop:2233 length:837 start_codon:yes stop_codon:yes gene_type:complete
MKLTKSFLQELIREEIKKTLLDEGKDGNAYAVCTSSIAKTAGTSKRSEWSDAEKKRFEKCVKEVAKKPGMHKEEIKKEIKKALLEQLGRCRIPRMPSTFSSSNYMTDDGKRAIPVPIWPEYSKKNTAEASKGPQSVWWVIDPSKKMNDYMTMGEFVTWLSNNGCHRPKSTQIGRLYGPISMRPWKLWSDVSDYFDPEPEEEDEDLLYLDRKPEYEELEFKPIDLDDEGTPGTNAEGGCGPRPPLGKGWPQRPVDDERRKKFRAWLKCTKAAAAKRRKK